MERCEHRRCGARVFGGVRVEGSGFELRGHCFEQAGSGVEHRGCGLWLAVFHATVRLIGSDQRGRVRPERCESRSLCRLLLLMRESPVRVGLQQPEVDARVAAVALQVERRVACAGGFEVATNALFALAG